MQSLALLATLTVTLAPAVNLTDVHALHMRIHLAHVLELLGHLLVLLAFLAARSRVGRGRPGPSLHHLKAFWGVYVFFHAESDDGLEDGERVIAVVCSALFGEEVKLCWVLDGERRGIRFVVITDGSLMTTSATASPALAAFKTIAA